ncbi:MAG TPA: rod shape-determining protein MreC [Patescibacteria group bacterium]|nr:rod shape-determining protein MreC [Patescibacteria group bacterium]
MQKKYIAVVVIFVLIILILLANTFTPIKLFSAGIEKIFQGPKIAIYGIKVGMSRDDSKEVASLKSENSSLVKKMADYEKLKEDNDALRSQFETTDTKQYPLLVANILGFSGSFTNPQTLTIDKGEKDGVKPGMAVIFGNNLVGIIKQPEDFYSKIDLVINQDFTAIAEVPGNNALGIARGQIDFILFDRVPINSKVSKGDIVLTKGEIGGGKLIPKGLVIGKVTALSKNENLPFQTAKIESQINFTNLSTVFIILKP